MWLFEMNPNSYVSDYQSYDKLNKVAFDILMFPEKKACTCDWLVVFWTWKQSNKGNATEMKVWSKHL